MNANRLVGCLLVGVLAVSPLSAQRVGQRPGRAAVIQNIQQIFLKQVITEMALAPEAQPRFQRVVITWGQKRSVLEDEERQLRQSLRRELTPGVAANPDSVSRFVDALLNNRVAYAESFRDEMRELVPILNPVQRGQYQVRRDQLLQRVKELQQQRPGGALDATAVPEP